MKIQHNNLTLEVHEPKLANQILSIILSGQGVDAPAKLGRPTGKKANGASPRWTDEEKNRMLFLHAQGASVENIAKDLGNRTLKAVNQKLYLLLRDIYKAKLKAMKKEEAAKVEGAGGAGY